jgi:hypothetical protein
VVKLLRPDQAAEARALRELRREAELLARLAHPRLVRGLVVARMLARDPARRPRPRAAAEAIEPLVAAVPDGPVRARRNAPAPPP